jgi:hypothetical protein
VRVRLGHAIQGLAAVLILITATSETSPQAPKIPAKQKTDWTVEGQQKPNPQPEPADHPPSGIPGIKAGTASGEGANKGENGGKEGTEFWPPLYGYRVKVTDSLLVAFTFLVFVATVLLWWSNRRLVTGAGKSAERQLRAYVFVIEAQILAADINGTILNPPQNIRAGTRPVAILTIKNTGQTPAYDVSVFGNVTLTTWPLRPGTFPALPFAGVEISRQSYGPGMYTHKFEIMGMLNDAQVAALTAGNQAIVIYGEIRYRDAFNQNRFIRYRKFTGGPTGIRGMTMASHEEGNETSEDRRA